MRCFGLLALGGVDRRPSPLPRAPRDCQGTNHSILVVLVQMALLAVLGISCACSYQESQARFPCLQFSFQGERQVLVRFFLEERDSTE